MKAGDYVRTKNYGIKRILDIGEYLGMKQYLIDEDGTYVIDNSIIKSADGTPKGLLSLIEVGDYVNGYKISKITQYADMGTDLESEFIDTWNYGNKYVKHIGKKDINSIVTKEQFERMEYKVK